MNRESDDPLDDIGTWAQPLTRNSENSASPVTEPTDAFRSNALSKPELPTEDGTRTPSETPDPSGDTTAKESRTPSTSKSQERTRAGPGSSEWDTIAPPLIAQGEVLFGKYRLDEQIGEGGMGSVWKVWHVDMESERALKLIKPEIAQNDKGWKRFRREAQLMDKIKHPGAVRVYDYKRTQGLGYIEMEFVRGRSVDQILKSRDGEPMPLDWTARVVEQLCAVLQEAHGHVDEKTGVPKPIIHRDLKPSNLMLIEVKHQEDAVRLKVLDFGIAKMIEDEGGGGGDQTVTGAGDLLGTPAYMSPEQIKSAFDKEEDKLPIDGRSDLYSTGVMLYHLLTGVRPFRGNSMGLIHAHLTTPPPPMKESNPRAAVPAEVERVVLRCLEKDPAKRPQSARELADEFLRAAGRSPRQSASDPTPRPSLLRTYLAVGIGIAGVAVLVAGLALSMLSSRRPVVDRKDTTKQPEFKAPFAPWIPDGGGYELVSEELAPGSTDELLNLRRKADGVIFVRSDKPGVYIPDGYTAEFASASSDVVTRLERIVGGAKFNRAPWGAGVFLPVGYEEVPGDRMPVWPRVLVRSKDKVKFIRIAGGTYRRGDPGDDPALDSEGQPCTPHFVRVPDFYIQETEVTNGEIEDYIKAYADREKDLKFWRDLYSNLRGDNSTEQLARARRFPATCIDYAAARKYAASVQGLLPTEAEWEYAARSRGQSNVYSWGPEPTPKDVPLKANLDSAAQSFGKRADQPSTVDEFPEDATDQHVLGMTGGVQEFCADVYKPYGQLDLTRFSSRSPLVDRRDEAPPKGDDFKVVVKGGSYLLKQNEAKSFLRTAVLAIERTGYFGFRVVIECPPEDWPRRGPSVNEK